MENKRDVNGGIGAARCDIQGCGGFYTKCCVAVLCCVVLLVLDVLINSLIRYPDVIRSRLRREFRSIVLFASLARIRGSRIRIKGARGINGK